MNVVIFNVIKRVPKNFRSGIEVVCNIAVVFIDKKIASAVIALFTRIWSSENISAQVGVFNIDPIVDNRDRNPFPARSLPSFLHIGDIKMPPFKLDRLRPHTFEFRNKIRKCKRNFIQLSKFIGKLKHAFGDVNSTRIENGDLISNKPVSRANL